MEITQVTQKVKCDMWGCAHFADFSLKTKKLFGSTSHYCKECLSQMYVEIGKVLVPKQPKTPFKEKKVK